MGAEEMSERMHDVEELKRRVRVILDENKLSGALLDEEDVDTLSVDEIIEEMLPRGAREVEASAPNHLLGPGRAFAGTIGWYDSCGKGAGVVLLPDDFLRLVTFKMSDWEYAVTEVITEDSEKYRMQQSRYAGIRGNPQRPVVAIVQRPAGLSLEFYSCRGGENVTLSRARYIPQPQIAEGVMGISEKLVDAALYRTAYLVAMSLGAGEQAAGLLSVSNSLMV